MSDELEFLDGETAEESKPVGFGNIWYRYKSIILAVLFFALLVAIFVVMSLSKTHNDITIALYTDNSITIEQSNVLSSFFSQYASDSDKSGVKSAGIDACLLSTTDMNKLSKAVGSVDADRNKGARCIYITSKSAYTYITDLYPDMFERFEGCDEWIPLESTRLGYTLEGYGFSCVGLGLSLVSSNNADAENYKTAVYFMKNLSVVYPDVFGTSPSVTPSDTEQ